MGLQIYVDDPAMTLQEYHKAVRDLSNFLLLCGICGFPIKLDKAEGGKRIQWVGATGEVDDIDKNVTVTIPEV